MNPHVAGGGGIEESSPAAVPCEPTSAVTGFADVAASGGTSWADVVLLVGLVGLFLGFTLVLALRW